MTIMPSSNSRDQNTTFSMTSPEWESDSFPEKRRSTRKIKRPPSYLVTPDNDISKRPKKPGRKPLETEKSMPLDPKLKRKAQNRAAQRAFRERKEQFVNELQQQISELKQAKKKREQELLNENTRLQLENQILKKENSLLKSNNALIYHPSSPSSSDELILEPNRISSPIVDEQSVTSLKRIENTLSPTASDESLSDFQGTSPLTHSAISTPSAYCSPTMIEHQQDQQISSDSVQALSTRDDEIFGGEQYSLDQNNAMNELFSSEMDLFGHSPNIDRLSPYFF